MHLKNFCMAPAFTLTMAMTVSYAIILGTPPPDVVITTTELAPNPITPGFFTITATLTVPQTSATPSIIEPACFFELLSTTSVNTGCGDEMTIWPTITSGPTLPMVTSTRSLTYSTTVTATLPPTTVTMTISEVQTTTGLCFVSGKDIFTPCTGIISATGKPNSSPPLENPLKPLVQWAKKTKFKVKKNVKTVFVTTCLVLNINVEGWVRI